MWITYIANGIAAIGGGVALMAICFWENSEPPNRVNIGFWVGVLTVATAIVVDFPLRPGEILRSLSYTYSFALAIAFLGFWLLNTMNEEEG